MSVPFLTPQQQGRLTHVYDEVARLVEMDRSFFEAWPDCSYRVRRSFRAEIEVKTILADAVDQFPAGQIWFTIVKQFGPRVRLRGFFQTNICLKADLIPEAGCRQLYEAVALANPMGRELDRALEAAFEKGGGQ